MTDVLDEFTIVFEDMIETGHGTYADACAKLMREIRSLRAQIENTEQLKKAYLAGFMVSGEGWNNEYPFLHKSKSPTDDKHWLAERDKLLKELKLWP